MSIVRINELDFHVQQAGPAPADAAHPPVYLIHGLMLGNMVGWYFTITPHLAKHRPVVMYDLRGHGKSQLAASGYDLDTMASDLDGLIKASDAGHDAVDLVGHSWGGLVALTYALYHPHRVRRLVLIEVPLPPSNIGEMKRFMELSPKDMLAALPRSAQQGFLSGGRQTFRLLRNLGKLVRNTTVLDDFKAAKDISDTYLSLLNVPVMTLYGTKSPCLETGRRLERVLPQCRHLEIEAGHNLYAEAPQQTADLINDFLGATVAPNPLATV
ncbi:alpha/beta fold hydrolase [Acanthopleuribacter pedis]|uniref:Alpha/beta hydrolase n=1 Tax=Acanthopleuribacter pedis TaxID=442870 RepID=A0A8J7QKN8_9BACT|nr:alpha/beta hydrolase [Acanthopleuribacter pedis]MBO1322796.1 alpha/beta hydrolase [Acanthopleuribacter pedis]